MNFKLKISEYPLAYDFVVTFLEPVSNVQLLHEHVSITTLEKGISADTYLKSVEEQIKLLPNPQYEISDMETVGLGR